jgi:hypothetical protein
MRSARHRSGGAVGGIAVWILWRFQSDVAWGSWVVRSLIQNGENPARAMSAPPSTDKATAVPRPLRAAPGWQ